MGTGYVKELGGLPLHCLLITPGSVSICVALVSIQYSVSMPVLQHWPPIWYEDVFWSLVGRANVKSLRPSAATDQYC